MAPRHRQAPRDTGFWGELAYRIEKALRNKDLALSQERQRLEHFFAGIEASPNGVLLLDAADQIDWCNSVAAEHFGLDPLRDQGRAMVGRMAAVGMEVQFIEAKGLIHGLATMRAAFPTASSTRAARR